MLDAALVFFQEELNNYIKVKTGGQREDTVRFAEIQLPKDITMQNNAITVLLINLEEERLFRSGAAPTSRLTSSAAPEIAQSFCMNFHLLFIANYKDYVESLKVLSLTLKFFRSCRLFTQLRFPSLSPDIQQLTTEFVNLTFMEQGELWRSLEMPSSPSVLYKVKMLVFPDAEIDDIEIGTELKAIETVTAPI